MDSNSRNKKYGWIWIAISPILWLMAAISTVKSITTYYIQLTLFSIIAILGIVSGVATLFNLKWAHVVLKYLSWLGCILFVGSGVAMLAYSIPVLFKGNYLALAMIIPVSLGVMATGLPFYFMARKLGVEE